MSLLAFDPARMAVLRRRMSTAIDDVFEIGRA